MSKLIRDLKGGWLKDLKAYEGLGEVGRRIVVDFVVHTNRPFRAGEACRALASLGRDAIPYLVEIIETRAEELKHLDIHGRPKVEPSDRDAGAATRNTWLVPLDAVWAAVWWLGALGPAGEGTLEELFERFDGAVRGSVMKGMSYCGREGLCFLVSRYPGLDREGRDVVLSVLGNASVAGWSGRERGDVVNLFLGALSERDVDLRAKAAAVLKFFGPGDQVLSALARALRDPDHSVRLAALGSLRHLGRGAASRIPDVMEAFDKGLLGCEDTTRFLAALGGLTLPIVLERFESDREGSRWMAAQALRDMEPRPKAAIAVLKRGLGDRRNDAKTRAVIADALEQIGPDASDGVSELASALRSEDLDLVGASVQAAAALRPAKKGDVPGIRKALASGGPDEKLIAAARLSKLGAHGKDAVPELIAALGGEDRALRNVAVLVLGQIGPAAKDAKEPLLRIYGDASQPELLRVFAGYAAAAVSGGDQTGWPEGPRR